MKKHNILAIIPARGGSKGVPRKNIKMLGGKPLIAWSIQSALQSKLINTTIVSSDDSEIISIAEQYGGSIPFVRPSYLATDTATTVDVLLHALDFYKLQDTVFDYIVLLQPTSPFRKISDIDAAIMKAIENKVDMVVSVKETGSNPYYVLFEEDENGFLEKSKKSSFTRRQDCPKVYEYNGSIYVINVSSLLSNNSLSFEKTIKYEMDPMCSIDIDDMLDFKYAEFLLENKCVN